MDTGVLLGGKYRLVRRLGQGGMGEVWLAHDEVLKRDVAVKAINPGNGGDAGHIARLRLEARAAGGLQHPGIAIVYEAGEDDGAPYFVMELLDGEDFGELLAEHPGGLPSDVAIRMMADVARALAYAHGKGIVHRDIKPSNLMRLADGRVKVCDFGIAREADGSATRLTLTNAVMGSPPFMAPEQWQGEDADASTDLYAFGVTLYMLLTGTPPFPGPTTAALCYQHLNVQPPHLDQVRPGLPARLDALLQRLLAKQRGDRLASAAEVAGTLNAIAASPSPATIPVPGTRPEDTTTLVGTRLESALPMTFPVIFFAAICFTVAALFSPSGLGGAVVLACVLAAVFFLTGLIRKADTFIFDREALTIPGDRTPAGIKTMSIRWDSVERIWLEREPRRPFSYSVVAWFPRGRQPSSAWVRQHGVTRRPDGGYVVYRCGMTSFFRAFSRRGVRSGRLDEVFPKYAGHRYTDPANPPGP